MSEQWYYSKGDDNLGPYSLDEMKEYAADGKLEAADLVWREGWEEWKTATEVEELGLAQPPPPPEESPAGPPPLPTKPVDVDSVTVSPPQSLSDSVQEMVPRKYWTLLLFAAAGLFFVAMFVPWWSIRWTNGEGGYFAPNKSLASKVYQAERQWYEDHLSPSKRAKFEYEMEAAASAASAWLWGWNTGAGVGGFVLIFFIVPTAIVPMHVKLLRPWDWIGRFALVIPGFVIFLLFLLWFFDAPSDNVDPFLAQGLILGPYISLLGSLCLLTVGIAGGIFGLLEFVQALRVRRAENSGMSG